MVGWIKNYYHDSSAKRLCSLVFFFLALMIFAVITDEIIIEKEETLDLLVFKFLKSYLQNDQ